MIRCVLDTNVWISAMITPEGVCDRLIRSLGRKEYECCISRHILSEINEVLAGKFGMKDSAVRERLSLVIQRSRLIEDDPKAEKVTGHPGDDHVLACAVMAKADYLVTGDQTHLLDLKEHRGVTIIKPGDMARLLGL